MDQSVDTLGRAVDFEFISMKQAQSEKHERDFLK